MVTNAISLNERIAMAKRGSCKSVGELMHQLANMKAGSICYFDNENEVDLSMAELVLEEAGLDVKNANKLSVKEYLLLMSNSVCQADEEDFRNKDDLDRLKGYALYMFFFIRNLKFAKSNNRIIEALLEKKVVDIYSYATAAISGCDENIINKIIPLSDYAVTGSFNDYAKFTDKEYKAFSLLLMYNMHEDRTLGELIKDLLKKTDARLTPGISLKEFYNNISSAYASIRDCLFRPFLYSCSEGTTIDSVIEKYS